MILSSWQFILAFLPVSFAVYFALNHARRPTAAKAWLVLASLFFYSWWDVANLPLMLLSIVFNFAIGSRLAQAPRSPGRRGLLVAGIALNLVLLAFYKYTDFVLRNVNMVFGSQIPMADLVLPLAISFFTFTQIAYLVDSWRGAAKEYDFLNYTLFVTYFPHLIAGPIVHHREMMEQFGSRWTLAVRHRNVLRGLFIFAVGLFKKVAIADTFAVWADAGFAAPSLDFYQAWATSLAYTFQLYFDFSGYCDMAIGASLLFNVRLPINFDSPYKALSIQDFWRRWHITLSNFLRDYLYIPLGGNRAGEARTCLNLVITFALGGLWHGASWMFVAWGLLHGVALVVHRLWRKLGIAMPSALAWLLTFLFVNAAWVFFRAADAAQAMKVLGGMVDVRSAWTTTAAGLPTAGLAWGGWLSDVLLGLLPAGLVAQLPALLAIGAAFTILPRRNSQQIAFGGAGVGKLVALAVLFTVGLYFTLKQTSTVFLYYNF